MLLKVTILRVLTLQHHQKVLLIILYYEDVLNYLLTLSLIQLHIRLPWSMMAVAVITMNTFKKAVELKVILVLYPTNVTHLIQLLDTAVF